ncbi:MAG: hybrid sensor histidine kinase/response regulator, partial [Burkholderia sp.]|nr:hybrid sensor histidine kinase/response regulator [Burkholderia sp.]
MKPNLQDSLILNVDDTDAARYAKTRILTRAGFAVIEAASGDEALRRANEDSPDLVLLDVKLPDINGFEVCRLLKEDPLTKMVLVLQTSASYIGIADKIRALDGGADNYLFEPIEPEELVANAKALLRLSHVERELREVDKRKDEFLATLAHELRN